MECSEGGYFVFSAETQNCRADTKQAWLICTLATGDVAQTQKRLS